MATRFGIGEGDRFSLCSGIAHDPLQRDIFTPIFFGAQIYIPLEDDIGTPGALAKWFAEQQINVRSQRHLRPPFSLHTFICLII